MTPVDRSTGAGPIAAGNGRELLALLRAVLCRPPALSSPVLSAGSVRLDVKTREVWVGDQPAAILCRELSLLERLMHWCGRVVSRPMLESDLHGHREKACPNSIEVRISTVRGVGYMHAAANKARAAAHRGASGRPAMAS